MSLKSKIIALLFALFGALIIVEYSVQHFVLLPAFVELERTAAEDNADRALQALEREVESLVPSATDWATWNETYRFMVEGRTAYIDANLNLEVLQSLKVNLMGFYTLDGTRLWGMAYDFDKGKELSLGELTQERLAPGNLLLANSARQETVAGLYRTPAGVLLVASRPVLTSNSDAPSRGRVIIGRLLDQATIDRLGQLARVQLHIEVLPAAEGSMAAPMHHNTTRRHGPLKITDGEKITQVTIDMVDVTGTPIVRAQVATPRTIVAQGRTTLKYAATSLAIAGALVLFVLLLFLHHTIFRPIALLSSHAIKVGTHDDLSTRLHLRRTDEIGSLAKEFDLMVQRLAETRQRLLEQYSKSGIAEMAGGVLHNIGNAITPLNIRLATLQRNLRMAPLAEMELAAAELANPSTPADHRADLVQFVILANGAMATLIKLCQHKVEASLKQGGLVQEILADQYRFCHSERHIEPVNMGELIRDVAIGLSPTTKDAMDLEISPSVTEIGTVAGSRAALQQVVANVLINAAESIQSAGTVSGRVIVTAEQEEFHGQSMVGLRFTDNGAGIDPDHLGQLFARGFSTKNRQGSGYGLHWSANTVNALGGNICFENSNDGQGACVCMRLRRAEKIAASSSC